MNNDQFRRLALGAGVPGGSKNEASKAGSATPGVLGSRQKASIPMTPRNGGGVSRAAFAKQMAERFQDPEKQKQKRFRSAAPKGSRFAQGYVDRAKTRANEDEQHDERAARLAALEESYKKEEIDRATFERLQLEIAGGDLSSTHLVKGLDFKLLARVRQGEDVFATEEEGKKEEEAGESESPPGADIDDELERLEEQEVQAVTHEKTKKKGQLATGPLAPGRKRTRDQILAELKAARDAAKAPASVLGARFKKIGATQQKPGSRIERDSRGREVLVIVDEDGHEKRKVRKLADERQTATEPSTQDVKVLDMDIPEIYKKKQEEAAAAAAAAEAQDVDIFDDAGADYDPLGDLGSDDSSGDEEEVEKGEKKEESDREDGEASESDEQKAKAKEVPAPQPRNYFGDAPLLSQASRSAPSLDDPSVQAALRKARAMREQAEAAERTEALTQEAAREQRLRALLARSDRDADDLDLGFGTNRLQDEADAEESDIRLSTWRGGGGGGGGGGGEDDGEDEDGGRGGKQKRKRGPKKRKGDGNNAADVLRVMERRKAG